MSERKNDGNKYFCYLCGIIMWFVVMFEQIIFIAYPPSEETVGLMMVASILFFILGKMFDLGNKFDGLRIGD